MTQLDSIHLPEMDEWLDGRGGRRVQNCVMGAGSSEVEKLLVAVVFSSMIGR